MRLSNDTRSLLNVCVEQGSYDRAAHASGIVHLGVGAFHRAHQAWYTELALRAGERDWMITGVSLRSDSVARQMNPQDGLYTVTVRSDAGEQHQLIGAIDRVLVGGPDRAAIVAALAAPATRIVTLTITEKGYCRRADGSLDPALAGEGSIFPLIGQALRCRHDTGAGGLSLLPCDNLADNGRQLGGLLTSWLEAHDPVLVDWFARECATPSTMIDRIVPATSAEDVRTLSDAIGVEDQACVFTEPFSQWVIADRFATDRPGWDKVGATLVDDVAPFEQAKLRMLNGAHSALAYLGLERGHAHVHEAMADPAILPIVDRLMREEAASTIMPSPQLDLVSYAADLFARFRNPALQHRLAQIAIDGTQKIPQRWLATAREREAKGLDSPAIRSAMTAWLKHSRGDNGPVDDANADALARLWSGSSWIDTVAALADAPDSPLAGQIPPRLHAALLEQGGG